MAFFELEKAFEKIDHNTWNVIWCIDKCNWLDLRSSVRDGDGYSEQIGVNEGVHQGSVLRMNAKSMEELLGKVKSHKSDMDRRKKACV